MSDTRAVDDTPLDVLVPFRARPRARGGSVSSHSRRSRIFRRWTRGRLFRHLRDARALIAALDAYDARSSRPDDEIDAHALAAIAARACLRAMTSGRATGDASGARALDACGALASAGFLRGRVRGDTEIDVKAIDALEGVEGDLVGNETLNEALFRAACASRTRGRERARVKGTMRRARGVERERRGSSWRRVRSRAGGGREGGGGRGMTMGRWKRARCGTAARARRRVDARGRAVFTSP